MSCPKLDWEVIEHDELFIFVFHAPSTWAVHPSPQFHGRIPSIYKSLRFFYFIYVYRVVCDGKSIINHYRNIHFTNTTSYGSLRCLFPDSVSIHGLFPHSVVCYLCSSVDVELRS